MYFVIIDLDQLHTRLCNSPTEKRAVPKLQDWLDNQGFRPSKDGFIASDDAINSLSCSEILFSEPLRWAAVGN